MGTMRRLLPTGGAREWRDGQELGECRKPGKAHAEACLQCWRGFPLSLESTLGQDEISHLCRSRSSSLQVRLVAKPVKSSGLTVRDASIRVNRSMHSEEWRDSMCCPHQACFDQAFVEAADGVNVVVKRPDASMLPDCAIEIVGTVNADRSVTEHSFVPFSSDFGSMRLRSSVSGSRPASNQSPVVQTCPPTMNSSSSQMGGSAPFSSESGAVWTAAAATCEAAQCHPGTAPRLWGPDPFIRRASAWA